jgi:hypothetical protein
VSEELVKRLRATYRKEHVPTGSTVGNLPLVRNVILTTNVLYNPDGPKAADTIEAQAAEIERLERSRSAWEDEARRYAGNSEYWQTETERLREALESIVALEEDFETNDAMTAHEWRMFYVARAALGETK